MRIDKFLSHAATLSRKECQKILKSGEVTVNGEIIKSSDFKVNPDTDEVVYLGKKIIYNEFTYIILNKPQGVVSATDDANQKTVIDLLPPEMKKLGLFPCGRLDKDTTGVVILTNDGAAAHNALSPKKHVTKKYYFLTADEYSDDDILAIENGLTLKDGYTTKPCKIDRISDKEGYIYLTEGKYHEIKRIFGACGNKIVGLERKAFGTITADDLECGKWRYMTSEEISAFKNE